MQKINFSNSLINDKYKLQPEFNIDIKNYNKYKGENALKMYLDGSNNHPYLFYSIYTHQSFKKIWEITYKTIKYDMAFVELLNNCLTICYCNIKIINSNHYLRLINTFENNSSSYNSSFKKRLIDNKKTNIDLQSFINRLSNEFNLSNSKIENYFKKYFYRSKFQLKNSFKILFLRLIIVLLNFNFQSLNRTKKIINMYCKIFL